MRTISDYIAKAAEVFEVSTTDMLGERQTKPISRARWSVMLVLRDKRGMSYPAIGSKLGDRDHSTVIHGINRAKAIMQTDPEFAEQCRAVSDIAAFAPGLSKAVEYKRHPCFEGGECW